MQIQAKYSHLNGLEWLQFHHPNFWQEIESAINSVDAHTCKTKVSKESTMRGRKLFSPKEMNRLIKEELHSRGWSNPERYDFVLTENASLTTKMIHDGMSIDEQIAFMESKGELFHRGFTEADFFKNRVSIEVQFGKYSFVQYDLFVKHAADYMHNRIDLGIEIVPMKSLEREMSSGPSNYERNLHEILRQGRIFPPVPLILIGIIP
jgi:hypothetical protein